jgi:uncharacterized OsmC-like protein
MSMERIADAVRETTAIFRRRPDLGPGEDSPATVSWAGGLRFEGEHPSGRRIATDMPDRVGGEGGEITPGWLLRAGVGACTATCIVIAAAERGIALTRLEIRTTSRSDSRGVLGMAETDGRAVDAGAGDYRLAVRIGARNASREGLVALVEEGRRRSPIYLALVRAQPVAVDIEIEEG